MRTRGLVVGAGGFLARHVVQRMVGNTFCDLVTVGRDSSPPFVGCEHHSLDCGDLAGLQAVIAAVEPDWIVSLAGSSGPGFGEMLRYNVEVAEVVLSSAAELKKSAPVRILLAGSAAEFGVPTKLPVDEVADLQPCNEYGLTKVMQTQLASYYRRIAADRLRISTAHFFNLIGPGSPSHLVFGSFVQQLAQSNLSSTLRVGNLESERDFVHVKDAAEAVAAIISLEEPAPAYVVSSGRAVRIRDLLEHLIGISGRNVEIETDPTRKATFDVPSIFGNSSLLTEQSGWAPTRTPEIAIDEMWEERE